METSQKIMSTKSIKKIGAFGIGLCALCCMLPIIGAVLGMGALSIAAFYLEKAGLIVLILAGGLLLIKFIKNRSSRTAPTCDSACNCKTHHSISPLE